MMTHRTASAVTALLTIHLVHGQGPSARADEVDAAPTVSSVAGQLAAYIQSAQHPRTGLPISFAQSVDHQLDDVAFTYDVAVAALVLAHAGSLEAARRALRTYLEMPLPTGGAYHFNTAYDITTGKPTLEYRVHGGPIFWMAIALMRYGQVSGDAASVEKGLALLHWARTTLPHTAGGVAMSHRDLWGSIMSVENNWAYDAALRLAAQMVPEGGERQAFLTEQAGVRRWLAEHLTDRGAGDPTRSLDVYTHALLVGPESHLEAGIVPDAHALARWARGHIAELDELFRIPGTSLYDYTDAREARIAGRARGSWLEGTEQVSLAYQTWAPWFEQQGEREVANTLRVNAARSHAEVLRYALPRAAGLAIPNTSAPLAFLTFSDGWYARPRSEPALNGTNWAYLAEVGYNPLTTRLPRRD